MKLEVLDIKAKKVEQLELSDEVFGKKPNLDLLTQYVRVFLSNRRQGTSSTKTRGEVSGGGKKPWKQKGLGRARHGSSRSPLWRKGGITHGPKPKSWVLSLPKKMIRAAVVSALSSKVSGGSVKVLEFGAIEKPNTAQFASFIQKAELTGKSLFVLNSNSLPIRKSLGNIDGVSVSQASNLNAFELLNNKNIVFFKDAALAVNDKYETK